MSEPVKVRTVTQAHCKDCSLAPLCLPLSLNLEDMDALDEIVKRGRPMKKGEYLFRQGDRFNSVYAVRSGALKPSASAMVAKNRSPVSICPVNWWGCRAWTPSPTR